MNWEEIRKWRKEQRASLIARREAATPSERKGWNERITAHLIDGFAVPQESVIGFCWPYRAEFDARFAIRQWRDRGAIAALPEVVANKAPLQFRMWWPGAPMRSGVYDIPVPDGTDVLLPDFAIVPMNGFDERGYRLGYGGGFFDRTLAACERRVLAVGVSYETLRLPTIYPQPHDIPMDFVVTEQGIYAAGGEPLASVTNTESRARSARLLAARRLPREAYRTGGYSSPACYAFEFPGYFGEDEEGGRSS